MPCRQTTTGITNYSCNLCDYSSENLYQFRIHLAAHGCFTHLVSNACEDFPFKCGYCTYVAQDEGDFGAHIASHLEQRNYRCSKCEFTAFKRSSVLHHITITHDENEDIQVLDLQADSMTQQGKEEPKLVNFDTELRIIPVTDHDMEKEGLSLYSPQSCPLSENSSSSMEADGDEDMDIIGLELPNMKDLETEDVDGSDCTEEFGGNDDEESLGSSAPACVEASRSQASSILRATLQGQIHEYGFSKLTVPHGAQDDVSSDAEASDSDSSLAIKNADPLPQVLSKVNIQETSELEEPEYEEASSAGAKEKETNCSVDVSVSSEAEQSEAVILSKPENTDKESRDTCGDGGSQHFANVFSTLNKWLEK